MLLLVDFELISMISALMCWLADIHERQAEFHTRTGQEPTGHGVVAETFAAQMGWEGLDGYMWHSQKNSAALAS